MFKSNKSNIQSKDRAEKEKMKEHADRRNHAKPSNISIGDPVLLKYDSREKTKEKTPFKMKPYVVTNKKGTMLTAERNGKRVTRNSSFFKPSPSHPEEVLSEEEEEGEIELIPEQPQQQPQHEQQPQVEQPQPEMRQPQQPQHERQHQQQQTQQHQRPRRERRMPKRFKDFDMS